MLSTEKVERMFNCVLPKDRSEIPVFPHMICTQGALCPDTTQQDIVEDPKKWMHAGDYVFEKVGKPDIFQSACAGDVMFALGLEVRRPGHELGENELYQFIEKPRMDRDDYRKILDKGWSQWFNNYMCSIQNPPCNTFKLILRYIKMGSNSAKIHKWLNKYGIVPLQDTGTTPVFDMLSQIRSFMEFIMDVYEEPDLVKAVIEKGTPKVITTTLKNCKKRVGRIAIYPMRSGATAISPTMFEEFSFPYIKQMVLAFHKAGYRTIVHSDGNWIPMLEKFRELPKTSCHFEFDNQTDLFKAAAILDGWHSFRGNIPSTMTAFGTAAQVSEYCESLITGIGLKTPGFMLGSGCEIPLNVKAENIKAMLNSVR